MAQCADRTEDRKQGCLWKIKSRSDKPAPGTEASENEQGTGMTCELQRIDENWQVTRGRE